MIEIAMKAHAVLGILALAVVAVIRTVEKVRDRVRAQKALSYCRRAADGTIYVTDPQTKTVHRLDDLLVKRVVGETPTITPRQQKRVRRQVRQALGAR